MTRKRGREARILLSQGIKPEQPVYASKKEKYRQRKMSAKQYDAMRTETLAVLANSLHPVVAHQQMIQKQQEEQKKAKADRKAKLREEHLEATLAREADDRAKSQAIAQFQALLLKQRSDQEARNIAFIKAEREDVEENLKKEEKAYQAAKARGEAPELQCNKLVVQVRRPNNIALSRERLPIIHMESVIMDYVESDSHGVILVCGATGSGKTTQVPQFLFEAGFSDSRSPLYPGRIGVTQPRRVAALSTAQRVAEEMSFKFGQEVGYQVRYVHKASKKTKIKFMTEGILLKEMQSDILLRRYSAIVLDEAHERSINTDLLIGLLSRIVPLRQELYQEARRRKDYRLEQNRLKGLLMEAKPGTSATDSKLPVTPLKLIIMSATLRVKDFTENSRLFDHTPPVVDVESRQFPVTSHFAKKTAVREYLKAACHKICQIHERLPPGGILVFCSTQREIELLGRMLTLIYRRKKVDYPADMVYRRKNIQQRKLERSKKEKTVAPVASLETTTAEDQTDEFGMAPEDYELSDEEDATQGNEGSDGDSESGSGEEEEEEEDVDLHRAKKLKRRKFAMATKMDDDLDEEEDAMEDNAHAGKAGRSSHTGKMQRAKADHPADAPITEHYDSLLVLPLYALLPQHLQQRVFQPPPEDKRLCVIATNVAETSITIPGIRYVVDLGRVKAKTYNAVTGIMAYQVTWTSQASADQRAGRAGRTCAGHCYRLYTPAVYGNLMDSFTEPEICNTPLDSLVLFMKSIGIQNISTFPFPTSIDEDALVTAMKHLRRIQALDVNYRITDLGRELAKYPLLPRYARMLHLAQQPVAEGSVLGYVTVIVSCLSNITDIFIHVDQPDEEPTDEQPSGEDANAQEAEEDTPAVRSRKLLKQQKEEERKRRKEVYQAQQEAVKRYSNPGSDLMTFLEVTRNYLSAPDQKQFCRENFLIDRNMREVAMLRTQLMRILCGVNEYATPEEDEMGMAIDELEIDKQGSAAEQPPTRAGLDFSVSQKPTLTQEVVIRKLIATGLIDQIARRATAAECTKQKVRYFDECLALKSMYVDLITGQYVWVHPFSSVARTQPCPEYVCYSILQSMKRPAKKNKKATQAKTYMKGVTIVRKQWLWELGLRDTAGTA